MGTTRNGARSALNLLAKACKLSRLPGFAVGVDGILGPVEGPEFRAAWSTMCVIIDAAVAADNYYNQIDYQEEVVLSEDNVAGF